ncbi:0982420f-e90f-4abf-870a-73d87bb08a6f-CDS [Sclerotinia trifoliorum]|uniref:0982420f-e90f-4abf-870a-73d87bb08a6f-CDS n=1 Tax=Sclerotinia trifoliorum TaxID=28548 RepID=A0A8H2W0X2_9HELO|nr:0982420f-e90f-4abf-870a-73d87bb08a6f-CDS [Sclerotinia trifoliorum]
MSNNITIMSSGVERRPLCRKPRLNGHRHKGVSSSLQRALKIFRIEELPADVWIYILDQLPISSAAAASICSKNIRGKMGDRYLRLLVNRSDEMILFLKLLANDLPNHIACKSCLKLHCMDNALSLQIGYRIVKPFDTSNMREFDRVVIETSNHLDRDIIHNPHRRMNNNNLGRDFNTAIWEMAMKRYNLGQDSASLLNIMSGITSNADCFLSLDWQQPRVDYTIAHGFMIQRVQRISIVDPMLLSFRNWVRFDICQHWDSFGDQKGAHIKNRGRGSAAEANIQAGGDSGLWRCTQCWTEFQINVEKSDNMTVMMFTRWKNWGVKPDKSDKNFMRHLGLLKQPRTQTQRHEEQVLANASETMMEFQKEVTGLADLSPLSKVFKDVGELVSSPSFKRKVLEEHEEKRSVNSTRFLDSWD